jgi:hypothetical protein
MLFQWEKCPMSGLLLFQWKICPMSGFMSKWSKLVPDICRWVRWIGLDSRMIVSMGDFDVTRNTNEWEPNVLLSSLCPDIFIRVRTCPRVLRIGSLDRSRLRDKCSYGWLWCNSQYKLTRTNLTRCLHFFARVQTCPRDLRVGSLDRSRLKEECFYGGLGCNS